MTGRDPRKAFGAAVHRVAQENGDVVAISVDSGLSSGLGGMRDEFPDRYIEVGIMEQAATGLAAGLATAGRIPVLCAIAPFVTARNFEMFRNDIGYMRQNVKIVGRNAGLSYSPLGPTHHSLEDCALARLIPGIAVITPADCGEIEDAVAAMIAHEGPVYLRLGAGSVPDLYEAGSFRWGRGRTLSRGEDLTVISSGHITAEVIDAVDALQKRGIGVEHLALSMLEPLDHDLVVEAARRTRRVVTVEEHYVRGGLGGAVAELLAERCPVPLQVMGAPHRFISSGPYRDVIVGCGLDAQSIADRAAEFVQATAPVTTYG
ncbi:transketolase family protein [Microbacterium aquimaris]|uniref:Transketolase C-terminal domain-containing protein n=1 Tax=Microbacterium aquimaris TaxID=459816 RepID=A0ABU5N5X0_9MICO|nr:transketolase C-terminal domain-containing protein [Microbacterium aquimaris]MDZ8161307.1 transketolase C-terminal domain-containing protein [Microbacterium aquimaris]